MTGYAHPDALVETGWLADQLDDPNIRIVEAALDHGVLQEGHIPGAVAWCWKDDFQHPVRNDLPDRDGIEALLGRSGIDRDTTVVLYGDQNNWYAGVRRTGCSPSTGTSGCTCSMAAARSGLPKVARSVPISQPSPRRLPRGRSRLEPSRHAGRRSGVDRRARPRAGRRPLARRVGGQADAALDRPEPRRPTRRAHPRARSISHGSCN